MERLFSVIISVAQYLSNLMRKGTEAATYQIIPFAILGLVSFTIFYLVNPQTAPHVYESLSLRIIASLLCVPLLFKNYWPANLKVYFPYYWYFTLLYMLPFFFTFMFLKNNGAPIWQANMIQLILLLILVTDWLSFILLMGIGSILGFIAYYFTTPIVNTVQLYGTGYVAFFISVIICAIFSRNKQRLENEKLQTLQSISSTIAHELRTPLATLHFDANNLNKYLPRLINSYYIAKKADVPVEKILPSSIELLKQLPNSMERVTRSAFTFIEILLKNANPDVDNLEHNFCIKTCINNALASYPFQDGQQEIVNWQEDKNNDFIVKGKEILVIHILYNLLKNALYFIEKAGKGEIYIWLESDSTYNTLCFKDTGLGIAKEILPHIFKRFFTQKTQHGSGIGLTFCKTVIEEHGGRITCETVEGDYTLFRLKFPIAH